MRYLILSALAIVGVTYVFLVMVVNDDNRWFHEFSKSALTNANNLKLDTIQYSAYRWRTNTKTLDWELFLAYYIKVDKDGSYIAMRHNTTPERAQYFKGRVDRSLQKQFDSLIKMPLGTAYFSSELRIYDGNTFQLVYQGEKSQNVNFIQTDAPPFLQRLSTALDSLIFKSKEPVQPFDLSNYEEKLKKQSLSRLGGLPKVNKAPNIQWKNRMHK